MNSKNNWEELKCDFGVYIIQILQLNVIWLYSDKPICFNLDHSTSPYCTSALNSNLRPYSFTIIDAISAERSKRRARRMPVSAWSRIREPTRTGKAIWPHTWTDDNIAQVPRATHLARGTGGSGMILRRPGLDLTFRCLTCYRALIGDS